MEMPDVTLDLGLADGHGFFYDFREICQTTLAVFPFARELTQDSDGVVDPLGAVFNVFQKREQIVSEFLIRHLE